MFLERNCPGCGGRPPSTPAVRSPLAAESQDLESLKPQWNGFFKEKAFFSYYRCGDCGLLYCPTYFTPAQLTELYAQMPDNTAGVPLDALRRTQRGYFDALKRFSTLDGDYLEVGPDIGLFTEYCAREGHFNHYHLFEPNRAVWPVLAQKVAGRGHDIHDQMFEFAAVSDHSISTAVMIHVLDHLIDPVERLRVLRSKLTAKAVLLLVTHDESSLLAKLTTARWPAYCLQHPQLFRGTSMSALLGHAGFDVLLVEKSYNHFPIPYLLKHLFWAFGVQIDLKYGTGLELPLRLGNILTVARSR